MEWAYCKAFLLKGYVRSLLLMECSTRVLLDYHYVVNELDILELH